MQITEELIETKIAEAIAEGKLPTKLFLDKASFEEFSKPFKPFAKNDASAVVAFHGTKAEVQVLKVDTDQEIFELV